MGGLFDQSRGRIASVFNALKVDLCELKVELFASFWVQLRHEVELHVFKLGLAQKACLVDQLLPVKVLFLLELLVPTVLHVVETGLHGE